MCVGFWMAGRPDSGNGQHMASESGRAAGHGVSGGEAGYGSFGSGYEDYIRILLFLEDKAVRNYRMMDVIQWNVRKNRRTFRRMPVPVRWRSAQRYPNSICFL